MPISQVNSYKKRPLSKGQKFAFAFVIVVAFVGTIVGLALNKSDKSISSSNLTDAVPLKTMRDPLPDIEQLQIIIIGMHPQPEGNVLMFMNRLLRYTGGSASNPSIQVSTVDDSFTLFKSSVPGDAAIQIVGVQVNPDPMRRKVNLSRIKELFSKPSHYYKIIYLTNYSLENKPEGELQFLEMINKSISPWNYMYMIAYLDQNIVPDLYVDQRLFSRTPFLEIALLDSSVDIAKEIGMLKPNKIFSFG